MYTVKAYMRSTGATSTTVFSDPIVFYTVSNPNPQSTIPSGYTSGTTTTGYIEIGHATSSAGIGSTTVQFQNPCSIIPTDLCTALSTHFPFSYIMDTVNLLQELGNGTGSADATMTFPLGAHTSTGSTTFTVINSSAISAIPLVSTMRTTIGYIIYIMTGIGIIGITMGAF